MNLSKNFTVYEATWSSKAIQLGIDNSMTPAIHMQAEWFAKNILQPIRDRIRKPFNVSSWYRCPALNKAVGGVYNSSHPSGMAVDFMIEGLSVEETWETVLVALKDLRIQFDQLIMERNTKTSVVWVHLSAKKSGNRNQYFKLDVE